MSMSSTNTNNIFPNNFVLQLISQLDGFAFLNMMTSFEQIHNFIADNIQFLIQQFITRKPYEKFLWEQYKNITVEQFKINLHVQEFVISNKFEQIIEYVNSLNHKNENGSSHIYGQGMTKERKLLFGILYHNNNYICNCIEEKRLEYIIYEFDRFTNDIIKYFINVITFNHVIGNIEECEDNIAGICEDNKQIEFFDYLCEMNNFASAGNILTTFICFEPDQLELFKEYCKMGIWSEHAFEFINNDIIMTNESKKIYFELVGRVNTEVLFDCVKENIMRDLILNPLTGEEQQWLNAEYKYYRIGRGMPIN